MFVMTMNKTGLRRLGAVAVCALVLAAGAFGLHAMGGDDAVDAAAAAPGLNQKITGAQDLQTFLSGYGVQVDPTTAEVAQVKIPRKWDDSFKAFNDVIKQSGLDLSKCKNRTVDKWVVPVPSQTTESVQTYAVVLVYKEQPRGAYFLQKPSGEVLPMTLQASAAAAQTAETTAEAPAQETAVDPGAAQAAAPQAGQAAAPAESAAPAQPAVSEPVNGEAPVEVQPTEGAVDANAWPTE